MDVAEDVDAAILVGDDEGDGDGDAFMQSHEGFDDALLRKALLPLLTVAVQKPPGHDGGSGAGCGRHFDPQQVLSTLLSCGERRSQIRQRAQNLLRAHRGARTPYGDTAYKGVVLLDTSQDGQSG